MKLKIIITSLIAVILLVAGAYLAGVWYFSYFSYPLTHIEGIDKDLGFMQEDQITNIVKEALPDHLSVSFPDGLKMRINLNTYRDTEKISRTGQQILEAQDPWYWISEISEEHDFSYTTGDFYDTASMDREMNSYTTLYDSGYESENAYIEIDKKDHTYKMVDEVEGTKIDKDIFITGMDDKVMKGALFTDDLTLDFSEDAYIPPEITKEDEDLNNVISWLQYMTDRVVYVDFNGAIEQIRIGDVCDLDKLMNEGTLVIDEKVAEDFVNKNGDTYDTFEKYRKFKNHKGEEILVGGEGDDESNYGFILNREETKDLLYQALTTDGMDTVKAVWKQEGYSHFNGPSDIGDTYIEISIAEQHLWYYKDGQLFLDTDVVTGLPRDGRATSRGVYKIFSEGEHVNLQGTMNGESWDSWVDYWFSVTYSQIGIHDASWRSEFGGDIYIYNGSHGCINVPRPAMERLYRNTYVGTLVVIY
ncbi:MAG: hypothetical protein E7233_05515 [Lachnospiraceae bacterium]|nr:hypothetical protein [Lachnospiraceae bacterium]